MHASPIAATKHPAITAFNTPATRFTPGMLFKTLIAPLAAALAVPASMIVPISCFDFSPFGISYNLANAVISPASIPDSNGASATDIGIAPMTLPAVVAVPTIPCAKAFLRLIL